MALGLLLGERLPTLRRSVIAVVLLSVATAGGITVLLWNHIWIGIALPLTGLLSMGGASWLRRGAMSQQHAQQIRDLLGQTTSPAVAQQLWDQRDELLSNGQFEGRQLPITALFTDTVSFTSVSERLSPRELMDWLNRGMSVCVPAITNRGGMVNKFTGDGMLAVFGVPIEGDNQRKPRPPSRPRWKSKPDSNASNQELRNAGEPEMHVRLGIHSGEALVGSMGCPARIEYAVIGDTVNCASRLESLEKHRHEGVLRVLISANTLELLPDDFRRSAAVEPLGDVSGQGS